MQKILTCLERPFNTNIADIIIRTVARLASSFFTSDITEIFNSLLCMRWSQKQ